MEAALEAMLVLPPFAQSEDTSRSVPCEGSPKVIGAGATQKHVEATGVGRLSAALRHAVSLTGQLRQQQHHHQHQDLLQGKPDQLTPNTPIQE